MLPFATRLAINYLCSSSRTRGHTEQKMLPCANVDRRSEMNNTPVALVVKAMIESVHEGPRQASYLAPPFESPR